MLAQRVMVFALTKDLDYSVELFVKRGNDPYCCVLKPKRTVSHCSFRQPSGLHSHSTIRYRLRYIGIGHRKQ